MNDKSLAVVSLLAGAFLFITTLSGCAGSDIKIQPTPTPINIPQEKFQCENTAISPTGEKIMESQVADYINDLRFDRKDCELRLKEIQVLIKCFNDPKCNPDNLLIYMGLVDGLKRE